MNAEQAKDLYELLDAVYDATPEERREELVTAFTQLAFLVDARVVLNRWQRDMAEKTC